MAQDSFCFKNSKISVMWVQTGVQWETTWDQPLTGEEKIQTSSSLGLQNQSHHLKHPDDHIQKQTLFMVKDFTPPSPNNCSQTAPSVTDLHCHHIHQAHNFHRPFFDSVWKGQFMFKRKNIWECQHLSVFGGIKCSFLLVKWFLKDE